MAGDRPPSGRRTSWGPEKTMRLPPVNRNPLFSDEAQSAGPSEPNLASSPEDSDLTRRPSKADSEAGQQGSFRVRTARTSSMPTLRDQFTATGRSTIGINTPMVDDNWLYAEMKGEADNLADYVKDLLDKRVDGNPREVVLTSQNQGLKKQIRDLEDKIQRLKGKVKEKEEEVSDKDKLLEKKDADIAALQRQLGIMEKIVDGNKKWGDLLRELDDLKRLNASLRAKVGELEDENDDLISKLNKQEDEIEDLSDAIEDLKEQNAKLRAKVKELQWQLDNRPWYEASSLLCLILGLLLCVAVGLAIALPLVILLPKAGAGVLGAYQGPELAEDPIILSATGSVINFQVKTSEDAHVYYCLVKSSLAGSATPFGAMVAGSSTPYSPDSVANAAACGNVKTAKSVSKVISIANAPSQTLPECLGVGTDDCRRCPRVQSETQYELYIVVGYPDSDWESSGISVTTTIDAGTADVTPPSWQVPPSILSIGQNAFTLAMALSEPGTVEYAVYYADSLVSFHGTPLPQTLEDPVCSGQLALADPNSLVGSVAASGSFQSAPTDVVFEIDLDPPCPEPYKGVQGLGEVAPCNVASQGLSPLSSYRLCMVATDASNNRQGEPLCIPLQTGGDTTPPLLNATAVNITTSSFDVLVTMTERGSVFHLAVEPAMTPLSLPFASPQLPSLPTPPLPATTLTPSPLRRLLQIPTETPQPTASATPTAAPVAPAGTMGTPTPTPAVLSVRDAGSPSPTPGQSTLTTNSPTPTTAATATTATATATASATATATASATATATATASTATPSPTAGEGTAEPTPTLVPLVSTATPTPTPLVLSLPGTTQPSSTPAVELANTPTLTPTAFSPGPATPTATPSTVVVLSATPTPMPSTPSPVPVRELCVTMLPEPLQLPSSQVHSGVLPENTTAASPVLGGSGITDFPRLDQPVRITIEGLSSDTLYRIYLLGQDLAEPVPNYTPTPVSLEVSTLDTIPPVFVPGTTHLAALFSRNFTAVTALSEPGVITYAVLLAGSPAPSPEQALAGLDGAGKLAVVSDSVLVQTSCVDSYMVISQGIEADTSYDVWLVAVDTAGNMMLWADMEMLQLSTVDDEPPSLGNVTVEPACGGVEVTVVPSEAGTLAYALLECTEDSNGASDSDGVFAGLLEGVTVLSNGTVAMQELEPLPLAFGDLGDASRYILLLVGEDEEVPSNRMVAPHRGGLIVETLDCQPPAITATSSLEETAAGFSATLKILLDEPATIGLQVVDSTSFGYAPTSASLLAVPQCTGPAGAVVFNTTEVAELQPCSATLACGCGRAPEPLTVTIDNLKEEKTYTLYIAAQDLAGNPPTTTTVLLNTPDSAPPKWMWNTPVVQCVSDFSAVLLVQLDEPADLLFAVAPVGQPQPSIDDLFSPPSAAFVVSGMLEVLGRPRDATTVEPIVRAVPDPLGYGFTNIEDFRMTAAILPELSPDQCQQMQQALKHWNNVTVALTPPPAPPPLPPSPASPSAPAVPPQPPSPPLATPVSTITPEASTTAPSATPMPTPTDAGLSRRRLAQATGAPTPTATASVTIDTPAPTPSTTAGAGTTPTTTPLLTTTATPSATATATPTATPMAGTISPNPIPTPTTPSAVPATPAPGPACSQSSAVALPAGQPDPNEEVVAYAILITGLKPLTEYNVFLGARDKSDPPNVMDKPTTLTFKTTDEEPPEIVYLDVQGFPPSSISLEIGLNEPGQAYFVVQPVSDLAPTPTQVFDPSTLSSSPISSGVIPVAAAFPFTATAGFCGATCGSDYAIYLVAEDQQAPPNQQDELFSQVFQFNCSASQEMVIYDNATETCTDLFLVGRARPFLALTPASAGFPAGPTVPMLGSVDRSFQMFRDKPPGSQVEVVASLDREGLVPLEANINTGASVLSHSAIATGKLARQIFAVSRSRGVWVDASTLWVQYQVLDVLGRSQVLLEGLTVTASLTGVPVSSSQHTCATPDASTGVGMCQISLPPGALPKPTTGSVFSDVTVKASYLIGSSTISVSAEPVLAELHPAPLWSPITVPRAYVNFPVRAVLTGSSFTLNIYAYSPAKCINQYLLPFLFDPTVLQLEFGVENSALYSPGLLIDNKLDSGIFSFSVQSALTPSTCALRQGTQVLLAQVRFRVISTASPPVVLTNVLSLGAQDQSSNYVRFMEDGNPTPFNTNDPRGQVGQINDRQGGSATQAQLELYPKQVTGVLAYLDHAELLVTTLFDGQPTTATLSAIAVFNDNTQSTVTPACILDEGGAQVATLTAQCVVTANSVAPTVVPSYTSVFITYQGFQRDIEFLMWFPLEVDVLASDSTLNRLMPEAEVPGGCQPQLTWQRTDLSAIATFDAYGLSPQQADVTEYVTFVSSDPSLVGVSGTSAVGASLTSGEAEIGVSLQTEGAVSVQTASVVLSDDVTCVVSLRTVAVTGGQLGVPGEPELGLATSLDIGTGVLDVAVQAKHELDSEGAVAHVRVYASFSDGSAQDVTLSPGIDMQSADPSVIEMLPGTTAEDPRIQVTMEVGQPAVCGELLFVSWAVCGVELAAGTGPVYVNLPTPTAIELEAAQDRITCQGDPATLLSVPSTAELDVKVGFNSGSLQDFSSDPRVNYTITSGAGICQVIKPPDGPAYVQSVPGVAVCDGICTIEASFGALSAAVDVLVVSLQDVTTCLQPWYHTGTLSQDDMSSLVGERDSTGSTSCGAPVALLRLPCASGSTGGPEYEQAALVAVARLTDGGLHDITQHSQTAFQTSDDATALIVRSPASSSLVNRIFPLVAGEIDAFSAFAGVTSLGTSVFIDDQVDYAVQIATSGAWCAGGSTSPCSSEFCADTFRGLQGAQKQLAISLTMGSGFQYPNLERYLNLQPAVFPIEEILQFSSDQPDTIGIGTTGLATLLGNSDCGPVELGGSVQPQCLDPLAGGEEVPDLRDTYANLDPLELDVDFGQDVGPPLHPTTCAGTVQVGDQLEVPVRINSHGAPLQSFSLVMYYDSSLVVVEGCVQEVAEKHRFSCNYLLTAGEVRIVVFNEDGINGAAEFQKTAVSLATVIFRVTSAGTIDLTGDIIEAAQAGVNGKAVTNTPVGAGQVSSCMQPAARRRILAIPASVSTHTRAPEDLAIARRELLQSAVLDCSSCTLEKHLSLLGDVNFDCKVDLQYDLSFLTIAASLAFVESREDYYNGVQEFLCVPGQCTDLQVPSCYHEFGTSMTEHQKLQLDLFHLKPHPSGDDQVGDCSVQEEVKAFRRTGFDDSIIPQCSWTALSDGVAGGVMGVDTVLLNTIVPVTSNVRQFFAEVAAKSTVLLGGFSKSELVADQLNLTVGLVDYTPELFQTSPLGDSTASQLAVYLDLRMDFPTALRYESPVTGEEVPVTDNTLVKMEYVPGTSAYGITFRPNNRSSFKTDLVELGIVVAQLTPAGEWIFLQPWYGSAEYGPWRQEAGLQTFNDFTTTFMPYTYVDVGSGVLPCNCGLPSATTIRDRGMLLKICLNGAARVRYIILPEPLPPGTVPPTLAEVNAMEGAQGGPEPIAVGAFDYDIPSGTAGTLDMNPTVLIFAPGNDLLTVAAVQNPTVTSVKTATVPPTGERYTLFMVIAKQSATGTTFWPEGEQVLQTPYPFEPGHPAIPLPQAEVPESAGFSGQTFVYFIIQDLSIGLQPTPQQILARDNAIGEDPVFSGSYSIQLPAVPTSFEMYGNVSISGGAGSPMFHEITGLPDRAEYSVYMAYDGAGMLQSTGVPSVLANVTIPDTQAPTFLAINTTVDMVDMSDGVFDLRLDLEIDEDANVTYAVYKEFDCSEDPTLVEVLTGVSKATSCPNPLMGDPVSRGSFEVTQGANQVALTGIKLSPLDLESGYCFEGSIDKVSSVFAVYLVAIDAGDTLPCVSDSCAVADDLAPSLVPEEEEGCGDPAPRQCGQTAALSCPCDDGLLLDDSPLAAFMESCHNNIQGAAVNDAPRGSPWVVWVNGQPQQESLSLPIEGAPAKVLVTLTPDTPPEATIKEGSIEEYYDRIVVPFTLDKPGRVSFMLTNITLPTETQVVEGAAGQPTIQGYQVANGRLQLPEDGSTSLASVMDFVGCPEQGNLLPASPYYLFYVTTDEYNLIRSDLKQLINLRTDRL